MVDLRVLRGQMERISISFEHSIGSAILHQGLRHRVCQALVDADALVLLALG